MISPRRLALEVALVAATVRVAVEGIARGLRAAVVATLGFPLSVWFGYRAGRRVVLDRFDRKPDAYAEGSNRPLYGVHDPAACAGQTCPIHRRTDHPLRGWPQSFRNDAGFMERTCEHGQGHPDPDDPFAPKIHGCDGCCVAAYAARAAIDVAESEGRLN